MRSHLRILRFVGASVIAMSASCAWSAAAAAEKTAVAETSEVVVTGSRTISNSANSPTPLTTISAGALLATTPASVPDALNKLPVFQGSTQPRSAGGSTAMAGQNVINLRNLGPNRALILLDGHRVTPTNADGTVSIDTLPLDLMQRVDVVTGGASAVYGSDAISGVVNFILNKRFNGFEADVNGGVSTYGDGVGYKVSAMAGTDLFDGRGHIEFAGSHYKRDAVDMVDRSYGRQFWVQTGNGSAANPFTMTPYATRPTAPFGGRVTCTGCTVNGQQFLAGGVLAPFNVGTPTGTGNVSSGGDGGYGKYGTALNGLRNNSVFGRFSYDLTPKTTFYVQASYADQYALGYWFPQKIGPGSTGTFFKNNPFLSPTAQAQLGNNGLSNSSNTFSIGEFVDLGQNSVAATRGVNKMASVTTGVDGSVGRFDWSVFYTHGETHQTLESLNNQNFQHLFASLDAVVGANGQIQCYAATQAATAAAYSNCVPINAFGPGAISPQGLSWISQTTNYRMANQLNDVGGSISGTLFDGWAGPIKGALSAEGRFNKLAIDSNALPTTLVDCTGLRICNPSQFLWAGGVLPMRASDHVWELAGEVNVPLLKDLPYAQDLSLNAAGRYTNYSTSGSVETWKVGLDYHVNNWLRFRGTTSSDIRAPSLYELFQPLTVQFGGFFDVHTNQQGNVALYNGGNANLVPEKARTYTAGVVVTPVPRLMASVDFYSVKINNAITQISGGDNVTQQLCENSGGTSIYCSLYVRPGPFSDRNPATNYPTAVFSQTLNSALREIRGWDFEVDYAFEWHGQWSSRLLANYQPVNHQQLFPGAPITFPGAPPVGSLISKTHVTAYLTYNADDWTVGLQDRWHDGFSKKTTDDPSIAQNYTDPRVSAANYVDINVQKEFSVGASRLTAYVNVQNIFNTKGEVYSTSAVQGIYFPVSQDDDIMGRYFTVGMKIKM